MVVESHLASLIRTKLHRPRVPGDIVRRQRLHRCLDDGRDRPLTLVSAPAGYGKSTLVSQWLETSEIPSAWLSLEESDSEPKIFLAYLLSAVRNVIPEACPDSFAVLSAAQLPATPRLAGLLVNELDAVKTPFILVLDDYHLITEPRIHDLLENLLEHPPRPLRLVIVSRRDPALSLQSMHARGSITEIRQQDLQLDTGESAELVEKVAGIHLSDNARSNLQDKTEGWAAGLRLVSLALRDQEDVDAVLDQLSVDTRHVSQYLLDEVLDHQSPQIHDYLCKTSILNRFCAPLCDAVIGGPGESAGGDQDGRAFIEWLVEANLFCITLDERNEWNRYHHLFQQLLRRHLDTHCSPDEIDELHRRASTWFEEQGLIEEALQHALATGDNRAAAGVIARCRHEQMNEEQWHRLNIWLRQLPPKVIEESADLLTLKAWLHQRRGVVTEAWKILDRLEPMLDSGKSVRGADDTIYGEYQALRSFQQYIIAEGEQAKSTATDALAHLPRWCRSARSFAGLLKALAFQMCGDIDAGRKTIHERLVEEEDSVHSTAVSLAALCFIDLIAADMTSLRRTAARYLLYGRDHRLPESVAIGRYFVGVERYLTNDLAAADKMLTLVLTEESIPNVSYHAHSIFCLSLTLEAQGNGDQARTAADTVTAYAMETNNIPILHVAEAFQAELNIRQGRTAEAIRWAEGFDADPLPQAFRFYVPHLTAAKVFLALNTTKSLKRASDLLSRLKDSFTSTNSTRLLLDVLALQALVLQEQGNERAAADTLREAVTLALPTGLIRPFVDAGHGLGQLLHRLDLEGEALQYAGRILAAFKGGGAVRGSESVELRPNGTAAPAAQPLIDPLTNRELDVLALLDKRLSNQEIADSLFISVETVKKHTGNIYGKLGVRGRRQAVTKASGLGILSDH